MRSTPLPRPLSRARAALVGTAATLALSLLPSAPAVALTADDTGTGTAESTTETGTTAPTTEPTTEPTVATAAAPDLVTVRLRVADRAVQRVAAERGTRPRALLRDRGVRVDGNDLVVVKRDGRKLRGEKRRLRPGTLVKVVDVRKRTKVKKVRFAPRTITRSTTTLKPGRRKVVADGRPGVREVEVKRTLRNGRVVQRRVVSREVVRKAEPRRVLVGRKALSVAGADGLNWGALARCESGGNPRAVNSAGYYGLYQFNVSTWRSVGGSGMPHHATAGQQTYRAKLLYKSRGRQPWPHCGRYL